MLPLFNALPTKAEVIAGDSSLFSAVKQRKGRAASEAERAVAWTSWEDGVEKNSF